jgi:hypothetical protein
MGRHARKVKRQKRVIRVYLAAIVFLLALVLSLGVTEVNLHGFDFFVFRAQGVGQTPGSGLQEGQGPGQPDANGKHDCTLNSVGTCR